MSKIMRSVKRDLRTMSLGLGAIDKEIEYLVSWAYEKAKSIIEYNYKDFVYLTHKLIKNKNLNVIDFKNTTIQYY